MALFFKPHTLTLALPVEGGSYGLAKCVQGDCQPYTPKADETPAEEGRNVKAYWRVFLEPDAPVILDAEIREVRLGRSLIEAGPLYVRRIDTFRQGLPTDHLEVLAVAYREEF